MASRIPTPKNLDNSPNNRTFNWELFKQTWLNYEIVTGLNEKTGQIRVATLLSIIGYDALQVYNAFGWNEHDQLTTDNIIAKFKNYCKPKKNHSYERCIFMSRKQKKNESIDDFVVAIRNLVKHCNYEQLTDSLVRDTIIMGIHNRKTKECLLREKNQSFIRCVY